MKESYKRCDMKSNGRGMLCESVIDKSKMFLRRKISQKELRLYPYLDYVWKNGGKIDLSKINDEEMDIIDMIIDKGHMMFFEHNDKIYPTREFYDYVQSILADTYVMLTEDISGQKQSFKRLDYEEE